MRKALLVFAILAFVCHGRRHRILNKELTSRLTQESPLKKLAAVLSISSPRSAFRPSHGAVLSRTGLPMNAAVRHSVAPGRPLHPQHRVSDVRAAAPGSPDKEADQENYEKDRLGFCAERLKKHGNTFVTGAFNGSTFLGDAAAIASATGSPGPMKELLAPPFARLNKSEDAIALFEKYGADAFAEATFLNILEFIPQEKEISGVWIINLAPYVDDETIEMKAIMRNAVLNAAVPWLFDGIPETDLAKTMGVGQNLFYKGYRTKARRYISRGKDKGTEIPPGKLGTFAKFGLRKGKGANEEDLKNFVAAVTLWARKKGSDYETEFYHIMSTVEQITALLCSMWAKSWEQKELYSDLKKEVQAVMKGRNPKAPITVADLDKMTLLDAFTKEAMRLYPPAKPAVRRLDAPITGDGYSLEAGTLVSLEPLVAHFDPAKFGAPHKDATSFDPSRWLGEDASTVPLMPFATAPDEVPLTSPGEKLAVLMTKMVFAYICRMYDYVELRVRYDKKLFEEKLEEAALDRPDAVSRNLNSAKEASLDYSAIIPKGYPVYSIREDQRMKIMPRSYYRLIRGVKKTAFAWYGI